MKNQTIKQFIASATAIKDNAVLSSIIPKNNFLGRQMNVNSMPWANVKYCVRLLGKVDNWDTIAELFAICFDVDVTAFWDAPVTEYYHANKYMIEALQVAMLNESRILASQSTDEHLWQMAGSDKLKQFSDTLPLVQLGKQFGMYPFEIGRKPYGEVLSLLAQVKTQNEVEREYQKLSMKK